MSDADELRSGEMHGHQSVTGVDPTGTEEPEYQFPPLTGLIGPGSGTAATIIVATELLSVAVIGILGVAVLGAGIARGSYRLNLIGFGLVFGGTILGALMGLSTVGIITSTAAAVVAYDAGRFAIGLGTQLRENSSAPRAELFHFGGTTVVATVLAAGTYAGYQLFWGGQPVSAVILLLVAAGLLLLVLQSDDT